MPGNSFTSGDRYLTLRKRIREQRRRVPEAERRVAERGTAKLLGQIGVVLRAQRMGVYLSMDGELAVETATADAQRRNTLICAPVIAVNGLRFAPLRRKTRLRENRLGVLEPTQGTYIDPRWLDVVLTPLVAFDHNGTRLGMGAGYYDRCFGFLRARSQWIRPKLIGIGYEFQRVNELERRAWDVPLWAAVTERSVYRFNA